MSGQKDVCVVGSTRIAVGVSTTIRVTPLPNTVQMQVKVVSGGTLEIVQPATAAGWASGWPLALGEVVTADGPAAMYLTAQGATCVAAVMFKYSYGATTV